ncbi:hypothetical protein D3C73_1476360 [compost metagenome]
MLGVQVHPFQLLIVLQVQCERIILCSLAAVHPLIEIRYAALFSILPPVET